MNKQNLTKQTLKRFALLGNLIARKVKELKLSVYVLFLSAVVLLCAFIHIPYNNSEVEGILGFTWMTSFLFAIALPLTQISSALLIKFLASKLPDDMKMYFNTLSNLLLFTGFFFMLWTLVPYDIKESFKSHHYYILVAVLSIGLCFISHYLHKSIIRVENSFRKIIGIFFQYVYEELEEKNLINAWKKDEFKKSRLDLTEKVVECELN